jgi:hypothetical protein
MHKCMSSKNNTQLLWEVKANFNMCAKSSIPYFVERSFDVTQQFGGYSSRLSQCAHTHSMHFSRRA